MSEQFGNVTKKLNKTITDLYSMRANYIVAKDISGQKSMHADGFECVATDGKRYPEKRWELDIDLENRANDYKFSVYSIEKIETTVEGVIVYVTRKCAGTNNKGKSFNTEIRLRDLWISKSTELKLRSSETIARRVWLDGIEFTMAEMRPGKTALLQGCGDIER